MNDKLFNKVMKILGEQIVNETKTLSAQELKLVIVQAAQNIEEAREELEANPQYQKAKEDMTALKAGYSEVKKLNNARIQLAVAVLNERARSFASGE